MYDDVEFVQNFKKSIKHFGICSPLVSCQRTQIRRIPYTTAATHEVRTIPEQMWNVIAPIKQQFGFIFCGFGGFKQLKPINEEHMDFLNSWSAIYIFNSNLCELGLVQRFNECNLLQDAYRCANGEYRFR